MDKGTLAVAFLEFACSKDDCLKRKNQHISTIIDDMGLMSGKGPGEMAAITSTGNT